MSLIDIYRREAAIQAARGRSPLTLVVTSYNPNLPAVKGTIQPYGIESGWMPLLMPGVGPNFGIAIGPDIGDQLHVDFAHGDANSPRASYRLTSNADQPPVAQSGEIIIQAKEGQTIKLTQDQNITISGSGNIAINVTGNATIETSGNTSIQASGTATLEASGAVTIQGSSVSISGDTSVTGNLSVSGNISN